MTSGVERVRIDAAWTAEIYRVWDFPPDVLRAWRRLARRSADFAVFVEHDWFTSWWNAFGAAACPFVVVLRHTELIAGIFPCRITRPDRDLCVCSLTNDQTRHYDFLLADDRAEEAVARFVELVHELHPEARIVIQRTPTGHATAGGLRVAGKRYRLPVYRERAERSPWTAVPATRAELDDRFPHHGRTDFHERRRQAHASGQVRLDVITHDAELDRVLDIVFGFEVDDDATGGHGAPSAGRADREAFYRSLAHRAMASDHLLVYVLRLDGSPIAADLCLRYGASAFLLKTAYDDAYGALAPGHLLRYHALEHLVDEPAITIYDLLGDRDRWEMPWANRAVPYERVTVYPGTLNGWARYARDHGWKGVLRRSPTAGRRRTWLDHHDGLGRRAG